MLDLRKVAVTGGLSSGKSSVCRILKELGAYVVSADKIVHQLLSSDANLGQEIVHLLGPGILVNNKPDRARIAEIVFRDLKLLKALETLIHPAVEQELERNYQQQRKRPDHSPLFVAEIPLLFETGAEANYDFIIAVIANEEECCSRFEKATGLDKEEYKRRMARQMPPSDKAKLADAVIVNNGSFEDLQQAVKALYQHCTHPERVPNN